MRLFPGGSLAAATRTAELRTLDLGFPGGRSRSPALPGRLPVTSHNFRCVVGARGSTPYLRQDVGGSA